MRIVSLEHAEAEGAGKIARWAELRGHALAVVRLDLGEPLPAHASYELLVIMGGGMNVYQDRDFPWLPAERRFVAEAIELGKAVLGVCLGAQLIADALGARVVQNPVKEIGWFPIRWLARPALVAGFPAECLAFHWHGDTFSLPPGAQHLAESDACRHQAFLFGDRVVGLQFHVEVSAEDVRAFVDTGESFLSHGPFIQSADELRRAEPDLRATDAGLERLLDGLAAVVRG